MTMAQVDSLTKTTVHIPPMQVQVIDKNAKNAIHDSNSNDLKGDSDPSSDIELLIEESDDKEAPSDNEDAINNRNKKIELDNESNPNKDAESSKSLDEDLTSTADLVRSGFSADEFSDEIDCLDAIDNSSIDTNSKIISNSISNDSGNISEATIVNNDTVVKNVDGTLTKSVNCSDKESSPDTPGNQKLICPNLAEVERNNNTSETIDKDANRDDSPVRTELSVSSAPLSESTMEGVESEIFSQPVLNETPETNVVVAQQPISLDTDSSKTAEPSPIRAEKIPVQSTDDCSKQSEAMSVDADSLPEANPGTENTDKSDPSSTVVAGTAAQVPAEKDVSKQVEKMSIDFNSTSEAMSVSSTSDLEKHIENDDLKETEEMSVDSDSHSKVVSTENTKESSDSHSKVISTGSTKASNDTCTGVAGKITQNDSPKQVEEMLIDSDSPSKVHSIENVTISEENSISDAVEKSTKDDKSVPSSSKQNSTEEAEILNRAENDLPPNDDLSSNDNQKAPSDDSVDRIHSPMVINDDKEPKSVDSNDIIIDSVESEIVELDAEDEPVILDDDDIGERAARQASQNKFDQLFANTAKEIAHDIGAEVVVGDEDLGVSTSGLEILRSLMSSDNESRKRRYQQNGASLNDTNLVEKRAKVSDAETSDDNRTRTGSFSHLLKKKPPVNRARKHTSSTNAADTVKEIEKRLQNDILKRNRGQASSPGQDSVDEFDFEINDNGVDVDVVNDERGDEAAQQIDNNSYKINMNYDVVSKDNLKNIFKMMRTRLTRRQLEEIVIQKCCEMIADSNELGTLRRQVAELQQAEIFRKQKILNLEKQISQLKAVCQRFLEQVKENSNRQITPIKITRSVGLQVSRDSSSYNSDPPITVPPKSQEKLKNLLIAPPSNKKPEVELETQPNVSRQRTASPLPSSINHKNNDPRLMNGNARISSPLTNSSSSTTPCSSPSVTGPSRSNKKITPVTDSSAPVIDLTDKDDKNENEANVAAKNLLSAVNGTYVTYVPSNKNPDQNRQVIKPGTSILVNGQLLTIQGTVQNTSKYSQLNVPHPAPVPPLPTQPMVPGAKPLPPKPLLKIDKSKAGIMLSWEFPPHSVYAEISKYQLYAYQETNLPARSDLWKAVGDVSALPLPMACTLTQFVEGYKYHFIVRAVDIHNRFGPFSAPRTITL